MVQIRAAGNDIPPLPGDLGQPGITEGRAGDESSSAKKQIDGHVIFHCKKKNIFILLFTPDAEMN